MRDLSLFVREALAQLNRVTENLISKIRTDVDRGLANATIYLDVFGRVVVSWIWLSQAKTSFNAMEGLELGESGRDFYRGKMQAARYFIEWELPEIGPQLELLEGEICVRLISRMNGFGDDFSLC